MGENALAGRARIANTLHKKEGDVERSVCSIPSEAASEDTPVRLKEGLHLPTLTDILPKTLPECLDSSRILGP